MIVIEARGPNFNIACECGWELFFAPSHDEASTVADAHLTTHDESDRHRSRPVMLTQRRALSGYLTVGGRGHA